MHAMRSASVAPQFKLPFSVIPRTEHALAACLRRIPMPTPRNTHRHRCPAPAAPRALSDDTPTAICCISACSAAASTPPPGTAGESGGGGIDESLSPGSACWRKGAVARRDPTEPRPMAGPRPSLVIRARD
eukprot:scaffold46576_cov69-Phaeocystis_antarctica.AAC.1